MRLSARDLHPSNWSADSIGLALVIRSVRDAHSKQAADSTGIIHMNTTSAFIDAFSDAAERYAAEGDSFVGAAHHAFESAWADPAKPRHVVMPLSVRLGRLP